MPRAAVIRDGLTLKELKFVERYFAHGIAERAYAEAYVGSRSTASWRRVEASLLLRKEAVARRLQVLINAHEAESVYDHHAAMAEANEVFILAKEAGDTKGMIAAATLKSRLSGLIVERSLHVHRTIGEMTDDELKRERERVNEELRALGHKTLPALAAPRAGAAGPAGITQKPTAVHRE